MTTNHAPNKQQGFSLLEVLITLVILAIGLLGLAGLQATGLKNNLSAYHRTQATQLAYDIADRMRANISAIGSYATNDPSAASTNAACLEVGAACTPTVMASHDLKEWSQAITSELPFGQATITPNIAGIHKISIQWDDNRDGVADGNDPNFEVSFQP